MVVGWLVEIGFVSVGLVGRVAERTVKNLDPLRTQPFFFESSSSLSRKKLKKSFSLLYLPRRKLTVELAVLSKLKQRKLSRI